MSSAFRNFVLTFLLALIVFGLVAWRVLPAAEAALLGTDPAEESSDTSDTASGGELSEDPNVQPVDPEKDDGFACLFVGKNGSGRICSLIFTRVSESRERYVVVDIPASTHLSVGSAMRRIYSILNGKDIAAVTSTISSLVGCDHRLLLCGGRIVARAGRRAAREYERHAAVCGALPQPRIRRHPRGGPLGGALCDHPGRQRASERGKHAVYPQRRAERRKRIYIRLFAAGDHLLFDFEQLFSRRDIGDNTSLLIELAECVETNAEINAVIECAPAMFSKGSYSYANVTYTTVTRSFEGSVVRVPDVFAAIEAIRTAYTGE